MGIAEKAGNFLSTVAEGYQKGADPSGYAAIKRTEMQEKSLGQNAEIAKARDSMSTIRAMIAAGSAAGGIDFPEGRAAANWVANNAGRPDLANVPDFLAKPAGPGGQPAPSGQGLPQDGEPQPIDGGTPLQTPQIDGVTSAAPVAQPGDAPQIPLASQISGGGTGLNAQPAGPTAAPSISQQINASRRQATDPKVGRTSIHGTSPLNPIKEKLELSTDNSNKRQNALASGSVVADNGDGQDTTRLSFEEIGITDRSQQVILQKLEKDLAGSIGDIRQDMVKPENQEFYQRLLQVIADGGKPDGKGGKIELSTEEIIAAIDAQQRGN